MKTEWNQAVMQGGWSDVWSRFYGTHSKRAVALVAGVLSFLFLRADMPYGVYPLGPAFLASCSLAQMPVALIGALVALFAEQGDRIPLLSALLVTVLVRIWVCTGRKCGMFTESPVWRVCAGASGAILFSLYRLFAGGFRRYDLLGLAVGVAVASVLAPLFTSVQSARREDRFVGLCVVVGAVCFVFAGQSFLTFSPSLAIAAVFCGLAVFYGGAMPAAVAGLVCGLAGGIYPIPLAIGGLIGGYFAKQQQNAGLVAFPVVSALYLALTEDVFAAIGFLGSGVPGVLLAAFLVKSKVAPNLLQVKQGNPPTQTTPQTDVVARLSTCFHKLADTLGTLSKRFCTPSANAVLSVCEGDCRSRCRGCMYEDHCWEGKNPPIRTIFAETIGGMDSNMQAATAKFHRRVPTGCPQQEALVQILRATLATLRERAAAEDQVAVCAQIYQRMGRIYSDALARATEEATENPTLTVRVQKLLPKLQLDARHVAVYGTRLPEIVLTDVVGLAADEQGRLRTAERLARGLGFPITPFEVAEREGLMTVTTRRAPLYRARFSVRAEEKTKDGVSGDLTCDFVTADHYYFALLCDGMGSGKEAALRARLCKVFAGQMLGAGCTCTDTLAAISDVLRYTPGECFSTFDLLLVDLLDGTGKFVKSGASASYVLRHEKLYRVASCSLPLGITPEVNPEETRFVFAAGDVVLLQSDGIVASAEDGWLTDLLSEDRGEEVPALLSRILATAKRMSKHPDDRTIGAVELLPVQL